MTLQGSEFFKKKGKQVLRAHFFSILFFAMLFHQNTHCMDDKKKYTISHLCYLYDDTKNCEERNSTPEFRVSEFSSNKYDQVGFTQIIDYKPTTFVSYLSLILPCLFEKPKVKKTINFVILDHLKKNADNYDNENKSYLRKKNNLQNIVPFSFSNYYSHNYDFFADTPYMLTPQANALYNGALLKICACSQNKSYCIVKMLYPTTFYIVQDTKHNDEIITESSSLFFAPYSHIAELDNKESSISKIIFCTETAVLIFFYDGTVQKIEILNDTL